MIAGLFYWLMSKWEGGDDMVAMFLAQRIILDKLTYKAVPATLKPQVAEILTESGLEYLIKD